jgi:hypothetical protein
MNPLKVVTYIYAVLFSLIPSPKVFTGCVKAQLDKDDWGF